MRRSFSKPVTFLLLLVTIVFLTYVGFEWYHHHQDPRKQDPELLIDKSLDEAGALFHNFHDNFSNSTLQLKESLTENLADGISRQTVYNELILHDFWGASLLRNDQLFSWSNFALTSRPNIGDLPDDSLYVDIFRENNVTYLLGKISFRLSEDDHFTLYTTRRVSQENVIPIAREQEFNLSRHSRLADKYPVSYNFYDPAPIPLNHYRKLQTANTDSVGIVYAELADLESYLNEREAVVNRMRTLFHIAFFFLGAVLFIIWSYSKRSWAGLFLQLSGLIIFWVYLVHSNIPVNWIPLFLPDLTASELASLQAISYYAVHAFFTFFAAFSVITTLTRKWSFADPEKYYQTFFYSIIAGALSVCLILFYLLATLNTAAVAELSLFDLELMPNISSWILFISTGFFISSVLALLIGFWWFLFTSEKDKTVVIGLIGALSFLLFYFAADQILGARSLFEFWKFLIAMGLFGVAIGSAAYVYIYPQSFLQMSGFRLLLIISLVSTSTGYLIFANAYENKMDQQLVSVIDDFAAEEDENAWQVTFDLLSAIEQRLIFLSETDIEQRSSAVQAQFQRAVQSSIRDDWRRYSYDIHLIDTEGEIISDYATNFDSPGRGFYTLLGVETSYDQEQIRRATNRPVVQGRPSSLTQDDYTTFYRGWIAIYDELNPNRIIGWIVAAVFVERPDFNKPIRAVLAASTQDDWKTSYYLAEFTNGIRSKSLVKGIYANQPIYNRLSDREREIVEQDSLAFISNLTAQGNFRELIVKKSEDSVIKASTPVPGFNNHLFSFFRFNVVILFAGLILFTMLSIFGLKSFSLFGQSRRFQNRLLDGLTLSTLLFLVVLILATQYAVNRQNESNLQREIITKLDNLANAMPLEEQNNAAGTAGLIPLSRITTPLDVDAIFYRNQLMIESTTPQIFQQNLLPKMLPYPIHDFLYNRQRNHVVRTIDIGGETLLIGYRLLLSEENEPAGVIAIPTFLQTPLYTEQLLETTSYLLMTYLLIFGVFIIGTVVISSRLTRPLQTVQEGLNRISGGNLETKLPVQSQDEIGSLSNAYNIMVEKLKQLQINLAEAEREAAWKEMAQQVAHEIKNPLTPMKLNLQHLKRQLDRNPENAEELRNHVERVTANIIEQIESLNKIASDFSKFARPIREEFTNVEINKLIQSVVEFYEPEAPGQIHSNLYSRPLYVKGSSDELRRTLINLVKNSIEAGGNDLNLTIRSTRNGKNAVIEVKDNGSGIEKGDRDKIFVPNFSTKSSGTGLGLAISKKIVEAHEGKITFETETGKGTTFRIELPLKGTTS